MRLIIDDYGTYIHKRSNRFLLMNNKDKSVKEEFSADKISQILIYNGTGITTDAIDLAVSHDIDIVYLDHLGKPFARTYSCKFANAAAIHRCQIKAYDNDIGPKIMDSIISAKIKNQAFLLKSLAKNRNNEQLEKSAEKVMEMLSKISVAENIESVRNRLFGLEGEASSIYYQALTHVLPPSSFSGKRTRQPPRDLFNALLGYGYGILFTEVERACILEGLDPYSGFLHTDATGKPSMVLDLMENFRQPVVDRAAISLITKKIVETENSENDVEGFFLNGFSKHKMIEAVSLRLSKEIQYKNQTSSFSDLIKNQAKDVVKFICREDETFNAFVYGG